MLAAAAMIGGCGGDDEKGSSPAPAALPQGSERVAMDPANFSADIDNRFWPMAPGTRWTYRELDEENRAQDVVVTATSRTKRIANGITVRVVRDTVSRHRRVVEDTFDWYAQDKQGNVWYLGEETAEYEGGNVKTTAGSWEAGVDGAQAGIAIPAQPADGMKYRQEYYEGEAEDSGEVLGVGEQVESPAGHYDGALLTKDTTPLEPDVVEYKLYAPGVGPVLALTVSGGGGREELLNVENVEAHAADVAGVAALGRPYP
jgi:hypothetical protein